MFPKEGFSSLLLPSRSNESPESPATQMLHLQPPSIEALSDWMDCWLEHRSLLAHLRLFTFLIGQFMNQFVVK